MSACNVSSPPALLLTPNLAPNAVASRSSRLSRSRAGSSQGPDVVRSPLPWSLGIKLLETLPRKYIELIPPSIWRPLFPKTIKWFFKHSRRHPLQKGMSTWLHSLKHLGTLSLKGIGILHFLH